MFDNADEEDAGEKVPRIVSELAAEMFLTNELATAIMTPTTETNAEVRSLRFIFVAPGLLSIVLAQRALLVNVGLAQRHDERECGRVDKAHIQKLQCRSDVADFDDVKPSGAESMRLVQAIHDALAGRDTLDSRLVEVQKNPEDPGGQINGHLCCEQDPRAGTWKKEEVAAARVVEKESERVM